ncbi:MAG TPA: S41 family peptidase [Bacteroidia bacterium]|jgi:Tol biopolymer transport system component/C-terminal processing protease CtpA/Prc
MKKFFVLSVLLISISFLAFKKVEQSSDAPLWMRYPSISPDGKAILFSYKGDIYKVNSSGGTASPLTVSDAYEFAPCWSPDGKWIAFASDRYGNYDVFVMPSDGGTAKRLTCFSSNDQPYSFAPDGSSVLFSSTRMDDVKNMMFPSGALPELYSVPVNGGRQKQEFTIPMEDVRWNKAGDKLLFHDKKGYEDQWRKHHTSSVARDVWMFDKKKNEYTKLTDFAGEDRNPVWSADEKDIYYLSEKSGSFNVWKMSAGDPTQQMQVTKFEKDPVRFLSAANNGTLCFGYNGEIYTRSGGEPQKVNIRIETDEHFPVVRNESFNNSVTDMDVSPNGREIVFVVRGEIFVTSVEGGMTKRITNTPEQERSVSFSPDGRSILFAAERNKTWGVYQTSLARKEETQFFNSTVLKEEPLVVGSTEAFQPHYSPDGNEVAYLEERTTLKVINLKTKAARTVLSGDKNYSYADGDQWYEWSPDGKYFLVQFLQDGNWLQQVGLVNADGSGKLVDLTQSGFDNSNPKWMMGGKMMIWSTNKNGMKNIGGHGYESDVYGMFFTHAGYDRFKLGKEEFALLKEKEDREKEKKKAKGDTIVKTEPVKVEPDDIEDRKVRLTIHSSDLADYVLSPDGEQLYYLCKFEKGYDLWVNKFREHETKMLQRLDAGNVYRMCIDKEGKNIFVITDGTLTKIDLQKPEKKDIPFNAEMNLDPGAERAYMFEHAWRQVVKKFYVTDLQKVDWNYYKQDYSRFLPYINNNRDFAEMMSEMLGELNASHTGCRYSPRNKNADETAALGAFYDESFAGKGLKIAEVIGKGPLVHDGSEIRAGTIIEKIDGTEILPGEDYYPLLNRKAGKNTLLSLYDEKTNKRWEETIKPITLQQQGELLYQRWVKWMQKETERLSNGQLGYMHVRGMNNESYREFYEQVLGKYPNQKGLIVDTRFNGGGWLHDDLATFLSGKKYLEFVPREHKIGMEPQSKWSKPSVVLVSEGNYSDAHMFPVVYKTLGIGKIVGMPVPGTGTAVWWEAMVDQTLVFGIPQVGVMTLDGKYYENNQLEPDYKVMNEYKVITGAHDQQLEKAVSILLGQ